MPRGGRRGGGRRAAGRMTVRRMTRRMAMRRHRRRRRRRVLLVGGMVAVGYAGYKMSKKDVDRVEEYTGQSADELTDEQLEQAMDQLDIDKETMSDEEWAEAEKADSQTSYLDELERLSELNKQGILTDEEFAAKKNQLLGL
jgi:hypothetical protein